jgi:hypothetical protein
VEHLIPSAVRDLVEHLIPSAVRDLVEHLIPSAARDLLLVIREPLSGEIQPSNVG